MKAKQRTNRYKGDYSTTEISMRAVVFRPFSSDEGAYRFILFAAVAIATQSGCASMFGTPEERQAVNAALPDYSLCENLAVKVLAPEEMRREWAMELDRRGADCNRYASMLNNKVLQNQRMLGMGLMLMQQPSIAPQRFYSSGGSGSAVQCFKEREWVSGFNRNCVYSCMGSETVQTIGATELCPLSMER
jgi:hypothetical protein